MNYLLDPGVWASLLTLTSLEIVLGVDNIVVLSILTSRLPRAQAQKARRAGLAFALALRLVLLGSIFFIVKLTAPILSVGGFAFSWRDLILIAGGLFLMVKATQEIHGEIEGRYEDYAGPVPARFRQAIAQIALMDLIFSIDSIVTAVGLAQDVAVMAAAVCIAVAAMYFAANITSRFIERHPTLKMLALAFLILIGSVLVADGFGVHLPRVYIYFAMGFAGCVEALNVWAKSNPNRAATPSRKAALACGSSDTPRSSVTNIGAPKPQAKSPAAQPARASSQKRGRKRARRK
jgi:predicted tellurium resistance membrane protein TerC